MPVLNPQSVTTLGATLLEAAQLFDTSTVKRELAAFATIHKKWLAAQAKVDEARTKELAARLTRGELDAAQDAAIDALALALVGDGFDRISPFKTFKTLAPNALKSLGDEHQASQALTLAAAVAKSAKASRATRKVAQSLARAAEAVQAESARIAQALKLTNAARARRDALLPQWMKAWAVMKLAAQLSETSGGPALAAALFPKASKAAKPRKPGANLPAVPI